MSANFRYIETQTLHLIALLIDHLFPILASSSFLESLLPPAGAHKYTGCPKNCRISNVNILLRASAKRERVFAEYENFLQYERPDRPDRHAFQWLITFKPRFRLQNGLRHLKATFNFFYTFKWRL